MVTWGCVGPHGLGARYMILDAAMHKDAQPASGIAQERLKTRLSRKRQYKQNLR